MARNSTQTPAPADTPADKHASANGNENAGFQAARRGARVLMLLAFINALAIAAILLVIFEDHRVVAAIIGAALVMLSILGSVILGRNAAVKADRVLPPHSSSTSSSKSTDKAAH